MKNTQPEKVSEKKPSIENAALYDDSAVIP